MDNTSKGEMSEKMDLELELTNKFLSGEMTFVEYSNKWYSNDDDEFYDDDDDEDVNEEEEEVEDTKDVVARKDDNEPSQSEQIVKKRRRRKYTRLSPALKGLMGEANLRFVRGEKEIAEKMCNEIIKLVPTAPEPYQTLAQIYEHDVEKSLQFSLLAAHLSPSDANEWQRLAVISHQRNNVKQEMTCYTQAIKADPHNVDLHLKRIDLLTSLEESKSSMYSLNITKVKCYHKIVSSLPPSDGETIMKYAKMAVALYSNSNEQERALEVMTAAFTKCSSIFTLEDTNIFLELLIARRQFQTCIEIFVANLGVEIEAEIQTVRNANNEIEEQTNYVNCCIPNDLPIDLRSKLLVCFIYLNAISLVQTLLKEFLSNDVETAGDLYMDIEEALSSVGQHELAMQLLEPLVNNNSFNLGAVWLKHAECLYHLGRTDDAIESYYKVLKHAPHHPDARRMLFSILEKKGCIDEALDILNQDYTYVVSAGLLYEQCGALKKYNKPLKYLEVAEALLSKTFVRFRHQEELNIACKIKCGIDLVHNFRTLRGENPYNEDDIHFDENENFKLSPLQEWELLNEVLPIACQHKKYFAMQRLTFGALMSKSLSSHRLDIEFYCLQACILANDHQNAFKFIRELTQKYPTTRTLNILNLVMNSVEETTHSKYLLRLFQKEHNILKNLFLGNNFITSGRYLVALRYFLEYHEQWRDPLSALMIGIIMMVMGAQKILDKHHNLVLQGISYMLKYQDLRKCDQEAFYNIGRAYQMLQINNLAIEYYERALACGPITTCEEHGVMDLKKETAYNLCLLYKDHSPNMARKYLMEYLVI